MNSSTLKVGANLSFFFLAQSLQSLIFAKLLLYWKCCGYEDSKADFAKRKNFLQLTEDMPPSQFSGISLTQQDLKKINYF